jgi:flavin-dependent dehydrogenase
MALGGKRGIECVLVEQKTIPRTKVCGSGLSPWTLTVLDQLGVGGDVRRRAFRIDGARIAGTEGDGIELRGHHESAVLIRSELDEILCQKAVRSGAILRDGVRVRRIERNAGRLVGVETTEGPIEADALIDCTGASGALGQWGGRHARLLTMLGWYEGIEQTSDVVELYFDRALRPYYGWVFPESERRVNVGICYLAGSGTSPRERFCDFVERRLGRRVRHATLLGKLVGHPVRASARPRRLGSPGVLVAGEAGAIVDLSTAEGIYHALVSGTLAGSSVGTALGAAETVGAREVAAYESRVRERLGPRMAAGWLLRAGLYTPLLDGLLYVQSLRAVRTLVLGAFAGRYHG